METFLKGDFIIGILAAIVFITLFLMASFLERIFFKVFKPKIQVDWYSFPSQYWDFTDQEKGIEVGGYIDTCVIINRSRVAVKKIEITFTNKPVSFSLSDKSDSFSFDGERNFSEMEFKHGFMLTLDDIEAKGVLKLESNRRWPERHEGVQKVVVNGVEIKDKFEHKIVDINAVVIPARASDAIGMIFMLVLLWGIFVAIDFLKN